MARSLALPEIAGLQNTNIKLDFARNVDVIFSGAPTQ